MSDPKCQTTRRAFTLVEMLITVGLVVLLMLAVTQIFSVASSTIGGGQALNAAVRDAQAAQSVFSNDFTRIANDSPAFMISSSRIGAYRNRADQAADGDGNVMTIDLDGDGQTSSPGESFANTGADMFRVANRNHRQDMIVFFVRGLFSRQTGVGNSLISGTTSNEAMIVYGHLDQANNLGVHTADTLPGYGTPLTNQNNFLASSWALGRSVILLKDMPAAYNPSGIYARGTGLTPLSYDSTATAHDLATANELLSSRFDIANTTMTQYAAILNPMSGNGNPNAPGSDTWFQYLPGFLSNSLSQRMRANSAVGSNITAGSLSQQVPMFVPACSQFAVEFAGDFVRQNWDPDLSNPPDSPSDIADPNYGAILGPGQDGRVDTVYNAATTVPPGTTRHTGQIRWYGMPRDTDGDGDIIANQGDVVPVRDIAGQLMPFERQLPNTDTVPTRSNFSAAPPYTPNTSGPAAVPLLTGYYDYAALALAPGSNPKYVVAWPPPSTAVGAEWTLNRPKMIRIVMSIDRPEGEGRLPDGQFFEYVFNLGF